VAGMAFLIAFSFSRVLVLGKGRWIFGVVGFWGFVFAFIIFVFLYLYLGMNYFVLFNRRKFLFGDPLILIFRLGLILGLKVWSLTLYRNLVRSIEHSGIIC
jgi:hypothetical protein